jgi:F-type H+-transporting ATPase subunit epsilon
MMNLKILLPSHVFLQKSGVSRIVVQTLHGGLGLLPQRLDCTAIIVPGILNYETESDGNIFVAIDQGALVKAGMDVMVSVRKAIGGKILEELHEAVRREFLSVDDQEKSVRAVLAKMETGFIRRFRELSRG